MPVLTHVTYRPKEGFEPQLLPLVKAHWPTLRRLGLVTPEPPILYRAKDKESDATYFIEIFSWLDEKASGIAHETPEVMAVWEKMGLYLDKLELAGIEPL